MRIRRKMYLVCYDICGDGSERRLPKVYKAMRGYGEHLQYSVFRCELTDRQLAEMERDLLDVIHHGQDQVMVVPLGYADAPATWQAYALGLPLQGREGVVRIVG